MRCFIIAATSRDGLIAKDANHNSFAWTSKEDKKRFVELTKRAGVVIVGSKTFETFPKPLKERLNVVYSRSKKYEGDNVETTSDEPKVLLEKLAARGFKEAAIIGGAEIYRMFIEAGLVDKIYLTVEPAEFGAGIPFYKGNVGEKFDLVKEEKTGSGTIFKDYEAKK